MDRNQTSVDTRALHGNSAVSLQTRRLQRSAPPDRPRMKSFSRQEQLADRLHVVKAGEGPYTVLSCVILSDRGMYLHSSERLDEHSILRLKLTLPHSIETLEVMGEVTRMTLCGIDAGAEPGTGILFVDPSEKALRQIRNFIEWEMTDVDEWEPVPSEFTLFDVLVPAALLYGSKPRRSAMESYAAAKIRESAY